MNKCCTKTNFILNFGLLLFLNVNHLSKNRFLSKLSKNGQFLLNEVKKISNDEIFLIKYKMLRMYDFHIDFQFQVK